LLPGQYAGNSGGDFAGDEFKAAPRRFVVKENAARRECPVRFAIIARQIESTNFADAIAGTRVEPCSLRLRHFFSLSEHLARSGKVVSALRHEFPQCRQQKMRTIDVSIESGKLVIE